MTYVTMTAGLLALALLAGCSERRMCSDAFAYVALGAPAEAGRLVGEAGAKRTAALEAGTGR